MITRCLVINNYNPTAIMDKLKDDKDATAMKEEEFEEVEFMKVLDE